MGGGGGGGGRPSMAGAGSGAGFMTGTHFCCCSFQTVACCGGSEPLQPCSSGPPTM